MQLLPELAQEKYGRVDRFHRNEDNRKMSLNGLLVIDKPGGMTSHDVVHRLRRITGERSIGHLGTLDPMATGVLPLLLGKFTRLAQFFGRMDKVYEGTIRFGFATDTYDADGDPIGDTTPVSLTLDEVRERAVEFVGRIEQTPPPFSAKKIKGVPAYKLARKHQPVELAPVSVEVRSFEILVFEGELATFRAEVSAGTYIRALAHELGKKLCVGAHLASLRRTRAGEFGIEQAVPLALISDPLAPETMSDNRYYDKYVLNSRQFLLDMPSVIAPEDQIGRLRHGNAINLPEFSSASLLKVFVGIAGTLFQPKVVLL